MITSMYEHLRIVGHDEESMRNISGPGGGAVVVRRKAVHLGEISITRESFLGPGRQLPLVIEPAVEDVDFAAWAARHRDYIQSRLETYGAILFRGFPLGSVSDFETAVSSVYEVYGGYGDLPRAGSSERIYTSTPYPPDKAILFHNESSHLHIWPMRISFFCVQPSDTGGETPLLDCREVCRKLRPDLLERFTEKGLMYVRNFIPGVDVSWRQFFGTDDKRKVEELCQKDRLEYEWIADDGLRIRHRTRAVLNHPRTGDRVFFNQIQLHHISCLDPDVRGSLRSFFREEDLPRNVYYGDGSIIEDAVVEEIGALYWEMSQSFPWQRRDIVMLDNVLTAHARKPYSGARQIVVAMGEMISADSFAENSTADGPSEPKATRGSRIDA